MTITAGSLTKPEGSATIAPTALADIDAALAALVAKKGEWANVPIADRIDLLDGVARNTVRVAEAWVTAACDAKSIPLDANVAGEEWHSGPALTARNARLLKESLTDILENGQPQIPGTVTSRADGQTVAEVFPVDLYDKALWAGYRAEVWMAPGVTPGNLAATMAVNYRPGAHRSGRVALVLGAGNISSIPPMDALSKLFIDNEVVILKMNPVNEYIGPFLEDVFADFIARDYLRIVYGGIEQGNYLVHHELVDTVHITGSDKTHDAIVFGAGPEGETRRAAGDPILTKPITSELGNVSPVIVVPGAWSEADIEYQGRNIAAMLTHNGGFNCIATRVIVTHAQWNQREQLLDAIARGLRDTEQRDPYYPGARERWERFAASHPEVLTFGETDGGAVPWTLIPGLDTGADGHVCFAVEAFAGVFGEAPLDSDRDVPAFLADAVEFCNSQLWGTLGASLIVDPRSIKDPAIAKAVDRAVADLEYGTVGVNVWTGLGYAFGSTTWGAFPGHDLTNIQSGRGVVHNTLMFDEPEKSVLYGPFRQPLKPLWFSTHKTAHHVTRHLTELEADPSPAKLAKIVAAAVRG